MRRTMSTGTGSNRSGAAGTVAAGAVLAAAAAAEEELEEEELEEAELDDEEEEEVETHARAFFLGGGMRSGGGAVCEARAKAPTAEGRAVDVQSTCSRRAAVGWSRTGRSRTPPPPAPAGPAPAGPRGDLDGGVAGPSLRAGVRGAACWTRDGPAGAVGAEMGVVAGARMSRGGAVGAAAGRPRVGGRSGRGGPVAFGERLFLYGGFVWEKGLCMGISHTTPRATVLSEFQSPGGKVFAIRQHKNSLFFSAFIFDENNNSRRS